MAKNKPGEFAKTTLDIMIKCLRGGPTFMFKMIPVVGLDAKFLFEQVNLTLDLIKEFGGTTISIVVDGNRVNQAFLKMFEPSPKALSNPAGKNINKNTKAQKHSTAQLHLI